MHQVKKKTAFGVEHKVSSRHSPAHWLEEICNYHKMWYEGKGGRERLKLKTRKREYEVRQYCKTAGTPKLLFKSDSVS